MHLQASGKAGQAGAGASPARLQKRPAGPSTKDAQRKRKADATLDALAAQPPSAAPGL